MPGAPEPEGPEQPGSWGQSGKHGNYGCRRAERYHQRRCVPTGWLSEASLLVAGQSLVAVHDWTFRLGPGVVLGVGNGLILGYMMWWTRLVPRAMSILGLIGGPALLVAGTAMLVGAIEIGSTAQNIATIPEFFWELSFGIWLLVWGFNPAALAALTEREP